jgi:hypothetical protein
MGVDASKNKNPVIPSPESLSMANQLARTGTKRKRELVKSASTKKGATTKSSQKKNATKSSKHSKEQDRRRKIKPAKTVKDIDCNIDNNNGES